MKIKPETQDAKKKKVSQDLVIHFPEGVPAFENAQNFTLIGGEDIEPFMMLVSQDIEDFGFFCIDPFLLDPNYHFKLNTEDQKKLKVEDPRDVLVLSFVTRAERPEDFTANLLAPVVLNIRNRLAKQIILERYPVRLNIWEAIEKIEAEKGEEG